MPWTSTQCRQSADLSGSVESLQLFQLFLWAVQRVENFVTVWPMVTYKRPATLARYLTNYKSLAHSRTPTGQMGYSKPCGHCALCGCFGNYRKPMVSFTNILQTPHRTFKLKQTLTCSDFGIYVATCVACKEQYVGQTVTKFSTRLTAHRNSWNNCKDSTDPDRSEVWRHWIDVHGTHTHNDTTFWFTVTFVENPKAAKLDKCEDKWFNKTGASIDAKRMILPRFK